MLVEGQGGVSYIFHKATSSVYVAVVLKSEQRVSLQRIIVSPGEAPLINEEQAYVVNCNVISNYSPSATAWVNLLESPCLLILHENALIQMLSTTGVIIASWDLADDFGLPHEEEKFINMNLLDSHSLLCIVSDKPRILLIPLSVVTTALEGKLGALQNQALPDSYLVDIPAKSVRCVSRVDLEKVDLSQAPPSLARSICAAPPVHTSQGLFRAAGLALGLGRDNEGLADMAELPSTQELIRHVFPETQTYTKEEEVFSLDSDSSWILILWGLRPFAMMTSPLVVRDASESSVPLFDRLSRRMKTQKLISKLPLKSVTVQPVVSLLASIFGDHHAEVVVPCPWTSNLILVRDSLSRVCLMDKSNFRILQWWRGFRDASIGWAKSSDGCHCVFLLAPYKGLMETWKLDEDGLYRLKAERVPKKSFLLNVNPEMNFTLLCLRNSPDRFSLSFQAMRWSDLL